MPMPCPFIMHAHGRIEVEDEGKGVRRGVLERIVQIVDRRQQSEDSCSFALWYEHIMLLLVFDT